MFIVRLGGVIICIGRLRHKLHICLNKRGSLYILSKLVVGTIPDSLRNVRSCVSGAFDASSSFGGVASTAVSFEILVTSGTFGGSLLAASFLSEVLFSDVVFC